MSFSFSLHYMGESWCMHNIICEIKDEVIFFSRISYLMGFSFCSIAWYVFPSRCPSFEISYVLLLSIVLLGFSFQPQIVLVVCLSSLVSIRSSLFFPLQMHMYRKKIWIHLDHSLVWFHLCNRCVCAYCVHWFCDCCLFGINVSDVEQSSIHNANHAIIDNR